MSSKDKLIEFLKSDLRLNYEEYIWGDSFCIKTSGICYYFDDKGKLING